MNSVCVIVYYLKSDQSSIPGFSANHSFQMCIRAITCITVGQDTWQTERLFSVYVLYISYTKGNISLLYDTFCVAQSSTPYNNNFISNQHLHGFGCTFFALCMWRDTYWYIYLQTLFLMDWVSQAVTFDLVSYFIYCMKIQNYLLPWIELCGLLTLNWDFHSGF